MSTLFPQITAAFLSEFEQHWNSMLEELECNQIQLVSGNRLRPQLCLWGFLSTISDINNFSFELSQIASVSVSIEMIHKASLLIDDWIDEDTVRHGRPSFHVEYSPQETILVALNMIGLAMIRLKRELPKASVVMPHNYFLCLSTLLDTIYSMASGALKELKLSEEEFYDRNKITEIMHLETAEIIGNCLLLGYYTGITDENRNLKVEAIFKKIGDQCGFLFQAMNDLEAFSCPEKLYEHKGNLNLDISKKRKNIGIALLYELANSTDKQLLKQSPENNLFSLMEKYHVKDVLMAQLTALYKDVHRQIDNLQLYGLSPEWCYGFKQFWEQVKKFGESRLKA